MSAPRAGAGPDIPHRPGPGTPPDDLDTLVEEILGSKPRPVDWARLTGSGAADAIAALDAWVRWLVVRYAIEPREIPPCWAEHGELVEELSALHTAHCAAYDPDGPPTGPADWHATLAATRPRLRQSVSCTGCRVGQHRPSSPPDWPSGAPTD